MVVNPFVPTKTVAEFIAYAKANPGKINMGSSGSGSVSHVFGERFKTMTGINLVHIPYRGGYVPDLLSGQVQVVFGTISSNIQHIRSGMLRALAVTTATRSDVLPDLPTLAELGGAGDCAKTHVLVRSLPRSNCEASSQLITS
jgi:tripartite-type tricarboxylate transporter receptor subunit TctC